MNKKASHVGFVLSFTIFVTALIFIYVIVGSPIRMNYDKSNSLNSLKLSVVEEISSDVPVVRIFTSGSSANCTEFSVPTNSFSNLTIFAFDKNNLEVPAYISGQTARVEDGHSFVKIYFTNNSIKNSLTYSRTDCVSTEPKSISYENKIFETKIISFLDLIANNYSLAKDKVGLVTNDEFNFLFEYSNGTIIGKDGRETKIKTDVFVEKYKCFYVSTSGKLQEGNLIIRIW